MDLMVILTYERVTRELPTRLSCLSDLALFSNSPADNALGG